MSFICFTSHYESIIVILTKLQDKRHMNKPRFRQYRCYIFRISAILTCGSVPDVQTTEEEKPLAGNFSVKNVPSKACNLIWNAMKILVPACDSFDKVVINFVKRSFMFNFFKKCTHHQSSIVEWLGQQSQLKKFHNSNTSTPCSRGAAHHVIRS